MTRKLAKADLLLPALLVALSVVPALGGVIRLSIVAGHTAPAPGDARFLHAPLPIVVHVLFATLYCLLGAFQFTPAFRLRWPGVHRKAGRILALSGLLAGATGLWMTAFTAIPTGMQGPLLYAVRLAVGSGMIASLVLGWRAILRRDVPRHEAFMIRAYALGQGAGTQVLVLLPWMVISGESLGLTRDLLMTLSWAINVGAAEWIIRRRSRATARAPYAAGLRTA